LDDRLGGTWLYSWRHTECGRRSENIKPRCPLLVHSGHWRAWSPASWGTWPMTRSWLSCLVSLQDES
jgi:hypothetical protein